MADLHVDERIGVPIVLAIAAVVMFIFLTPVTMWFSVNRMDIRDAATWEQVTVDYSRDIHRPFYGEWRVMVREVTEAGTEVICSTDWHPNDYKTDSVLPEPVSLEWLMWTEPACYRLPPGDYEATITWSVNQDSWLFNREVSRTDTFQIYGQT